MSRSDPHRPLLRGLTALHPGLMILTSRSEPWASVTFTGARHVITCAPGPDLAGIEEAELPLAGHIVADIIVRARGAHIIVEALTIENC